MVNLKQKKQMQEYLASRLDGSGTPVISIKGDANLIVLKDKGLVLLADQSFTGEEFARAYTGASNVYSRAPAVIFYKDGKTFFRDAAHGEKAGINSNRFRRSLAHYTNEQKQKMILLSPAERLVKDKKHWLQYYQPASERLEEGIESFEFQPVTFDYSHIDPASRFRPEDKDSERIHMWLRRNHNGCCLDFQNGYLVSRGSKAAS